jgi:hypothetical protein
LLLHANNLRFAAETLSKKISNHFTHVVSASGQTQARFGGCCAGVQATVCRSSR